MRLSHDEEQFVRYAQLFLRLLGIFFVVEGGGSAVGGGLYSLIQSAALRQAGVDYYPDPYALGWFAGGIVLLVVGIYLAIGGRWVMERVVLPSYLSVRQRNDALGFEDKR